jgi:hypothetical protein
MLLRQLGCTFVGVAGSWPMQRNASSGRRWRLASSGQVSLNMMLGTEPTSWHPCPSSASTTETEDLARSVSRAPKPTSWQPCCSTCTYSQQDSLGRLSSQVYILAPSVAEDCSGLAVGNTLCKSREAPHACASSTLIIGHLCDARMAWIVVFAFATAFV